MKFFSWGGARAKFLYSCMLTLFVVLFLNGVSVVKVVKF